MSIPSRIIANSLARNSIERVPASIRGSLKTPASSRLYHRTNPSRSQVRIFSLSPRRERNTNRLLPTGSWPITDFTRSASRSKPQRISVVSVASQMRGPCESSSACRLGKPIMLPSPARSATLADDLHRIPALPEGCAPCSGESQWHDNVPPLASVARSTPSLLLPQTSPLRPRGSVSSSRKKANHEDHGHDRMHSPSDHFDSALIKAPATSSIILPAPASFHNSDAW